MTEVSSENAPPIVVVVAGPNGAGKSTAAPRLLHERYRIDEFVNADVIARGLSGFAPERVAIKAGRIMLQRLEELTLQKVSFAFEATLSGRAFAPWLEQLVSNGYEFHLYFHWLPTPDMAVDRVAQRVAKGGHFVPEETIRRRYFGGIRNLLNLYIPLASYWKVRNNMFTVELPEIASGCGWGSVNVTNYAEWCAIHEIARIENP